MFEIKKLGGRGSVSLFMAFVSLSIFLLFLFALLLPFTQLINISFMAQGQSLIADAEQSFSTIEDAGIKAQLQDVVQASQESFATSFDVVGFFFSFGWIILILVVVLVLFMWSRQLVETQIA